MQVEDAQVSLSPARQPNLYPKKRRRSSGIPPMNFNNPEDFSSSPYSADSANSDDTDRTFMDAEEQGSSSDSDDKDLVEDETITGVDIEDVTTRSDGNLSTGSSGRLEEALQEAARQAGTQGIDYDENGDITMEMADDEITTAFRSGMVRCSNTFEDAGQSKAMQGLERIIPSSPASRRKTSALAKSSNEQTMEFTQAFGKILQTDSKGSGSENDEEELTMDITTAIGGILSKQQEKTPRTSDLLVHHDQDMDLTVAVGAILPDNPGPAEHGEDETMGMDLTTAIGAILPKKLKATVPCQVQSNTEQVSKIFQSPETAMHDTTSGRALQRSNLSESRVPEHIRTTASETGSPSLVITGSRKSSNKNAALRPSLTPKTTPRQSTPVKKPTTPSKQSTPRVIKPITPGKTPPQKNVSMRTGSPKKLFASEIKKAATSPIPKISNYDKNQTFSSVSDSDVVSKTRARRPSGLGIDKNGMGSPRVSALLDARGSIGEDAEPFVAGKHLQAEVRFADPQILPENVEQERVVAERHESGRRILQEANEQDMEIETDATSNLKGMIESLTPQKKTKTKLSGRKSLHVGTAVGILGKRPTELDEFEDEDDRTPKRLRGVEASPVRKIKLPAPPPKVVTDGRITRSGRVSLGEIAANARLNTPSQDASPAKNSNSITAKDQPRYTDISTDATTPVVATLGLSGTQNHVEEVPKPSNGEERVHLQDFLKLTSIRFMELTTTRRRPTLAPHCSLESSARTTRVDAANAVSGDTGSELETCVIAGTCTLPMLDLYQHVSRLATHKLHKY